MSSSTWDVQRAKSRGVHGAGQPICKRCGAVSVLDPCRSCASQEELALLPPAPVSRG